MNSAASVRSKRSPTVSHSADRSQTPAARDAQAGRERDVSCCRCAEYAFGATGSVSGQRAGVANGPDSNVALRGASATVHLASVTAKAITRA